MEIELKDLTKGDKVWCGGNSGFCHDIIEKVTDTSDKYDENTGDLYKVIHLGKSRKFDSRTGAALTPPTAYYLSPTDQNE